MKFVVAVALILSAPASAAGIEAKAVLKPIGEHAIADRTRFKQRNAVRLRDKPGSVGRQRLLPLPVTDFGNGTITGRLAGLPTNEASDTARGFLGIAFRVQPDGRYEAFYIRPTNGRSDDQLRRNHSTQYISEPEYPWHRLRKEHPGVYESYADMAPGEWIDFRIEVDGQKARLFLGRAEQPALIVNDLKLGADARGGVALWVGPEAEGYFADIAVKRRD